MSTVGVSIDVARLEAFQNRCGSEGSKSNLERKTNEVAVGVLRQNPSTNGLETISRSHKPRNYKEFNWNLGVQLRNEGYSKEQIRVALESHGVFEEIKNGSESLEIYAPVIRVQPPAAELAKAPQVPAANPIKESQVGDYELTNFFLLSQLQEEGYSPGQIKTVLDSHNVFKQVKDGALPLRNYESEIREKGPAAKDPVGINSVKESQPTNYKEFNKQLGWQLREEGYSGSQITTVLKSYGVFEKVKEGSVSLDLFTALIRSRDPSDHDSLEKFPPNQALRNQLVKMGYAHDQLDSVILQLAEIHTVANCFS